MEGTGLYAYGFRYYDPASARFTGVDPIADQFAFVSGFNYAENSPIANIDLHGLQKWSTIFGDISKFLGISNGPLNDNAPKSAQEADSYAGRRAAVKETMDGVETVVEVQAIFVPGAGALLNSIRGNYGNAALDIGIDLGSTFFPIFKMKKAAKVFKLLSKNEEEITKGAVSILNSEKFREGIAKMTQGEFFETMINGTKVVFEPDYPYSGLTLFKENGFVIGKEALGSFDELTKTVLHESHRLSTSTLKTGQGVTQNAIKNETDGAFDFANRAFEYITRHE